MNILVTGAKGQLGMSFEKISSDYPEHTFTFTDLPEADITDKVSMECLVKECGAGVIINCAAYTNVEKAERECADQALWVNVEGPAVLADVAKMSGCALVHISTDYVFGSNGDTPLREQDETLPLSVYGITKLAGESKVLAGCENSLIVRTSWLYSEFGTNFMKTMLRLSATNDQVYVVDDQTGTPTYATDLARALMVLIERGIIGHNIYHFSNSGETTWCGFAKEIFSRAGKPTQVVAITSADYPSQVRRPSHSVLDTSKIESLGVVAPGWQDALARCLAAQVADE